MTRLSLGADFCRQVILDPTYWPTVATWKVAGGNVLDELMRASHDHDYMRYTVDSWPSCSYCRLSEQVTRILDCRTDPCQLYFTPLYIYTLHHILSVFISSLKHVCQRRDICPLRNREHWETEAIGTHIHFPSPPSPGR